MSLAALHSNGNFQKSRSVCATIVDRQRGHAGRRSWSEQPRSGHVRTRHSHISALEAAPMGHENICWTCASGSKLRWLARRRRPKIAQRRPHEWAQLGNPNGYFEPLRRMALARRGSGTQRPSPELRSTRTIFKVPSRRSEQPPTTFGGWPPPRELNSERLEMAFRFSNKG